MAGQPINCPHCHLETLLFIPNPASPTKPPPLERKKNSAGLILAAIVLLFVVILVFVAGKGSNQKQITPSNFKPVVGAFGWKLGDRLPDQLKNEVKDGTYRFIPREKTPPFDEYELRLTDDGRIYCIKVSGYADGYEESESYKNAMIALLTEKYSRRPKGQDFSLGVGENYFFGSDDQTAHLNIYNDHLITLEYYDRDLQNISYGEDATRRKRDEDEKKAILSKGL
jgi:hypothetical protein